MNTSPLFFLVKRFFILSVVLWRENSLYSKARSINVGLEAVHVSGSAPIWSCNQNSKSHHFKDNKGSSWRQGKPFPPANPWVWATFDLKSFCSVNSVRSWRFIVGSSVRWLRWSIHAAFQRLDLSCRVNQLLHTQPWEGSQSPLMAVLKTHFLRGAAALVLWCMWDEQPRGCTGLQLWAILLPLATSCNMFSVRLQAATLPVGR